MNYRIRYFEPATRTATEAVLAAVSADAAALQAKARGWLVLEVAPVAQPWRLLTYRIDVRLFCRELKTLLTAGMTIVEAVETLASRKHSHPNQSVYGAVLEAIQQGRPFSAALADSGFGFPLVLVAGIQASETSGRLTEALDQYIRYEDLMSESKRRVVSAAIYPALVIGFGLLVTLFLLGHVVPRFTQIYDDVAGQLSGLTHLIMWTGKLVGGYFGWIAAASALGLTGTAILLTRSAVRKIFLANLLRIPILLRFAESFQLARIHKTLSLLLQGGFPLMEALRLVQPLAFTGGLQQRVNKVRVAISQGAPISQVFAHHTLVDEVGERLLVVGERNGNLAQVLGSIADEGQRAFDTAVERITRIVEPLLIMTVALFIGAIVVMMYLPIFDLAGGVL
jgi:general secretion pathway protein F